MPKINQEEYEVLKELDDKWELIARNADDVLWVMESDLLEKSSFYKTWMDFTKKDVEQLKTDLFQFIQWSDDEPYKISDLIEEYEEETEVKKQELIEKWESAIEAAEFYGKGKEEKLVSYMKDFVSDLNQLDEPEVLSWDWISDNAVVGQYPDGMGYVVPAHKLQNLLVPKQELPVIPNYVAKWISKHHERFDLYPALKRLENNALSWEEVYEWYRKNTRKFVNAYLTGEYDVEEEQKYYVINTKHRMMLVRMMDGKTITEADPFPLGELYEGERESHRLTEQEIKDYDERYWPFAVKVEELEE